LLDTAGYALASTLFKLDVWRFDELWPESILRDECLAVLSIAERSTLLAGNETLDYATALGEAAAWLATRDPSERAAREPIGQLTFADGC
jgi:hypothetical protein